MIAHEMTYGVEIECGIDRNVNLRVGGYHAGTSCTALPSFEGRYWNAQSDSSLHFSERRAVEFVSPILKGAEGLDNIRAVCAQIKSWGGVTNNSCGLHVHVGVPANLSVQQIRCLYQLVGRFENALYSCTGTPERRLGRYCQPIKTDANKRIDWNRHRCKEDLRYSEHTREMQDRYRILNVTPFLCGRQNTVEFRVFSGSLNPAKIAAWIQVCLSLVEMALDGVDSDWDIKQESLGAKYGPTMGERNVYYMCKYMWQWKVRRSRNYGELNHTVFTRKAATKILRQLAARHDERAASL
jgi:hypothetical protein